MELLRDIVVAILVGVAFYGVIVIAARVRARRLGDPSRGWDAVTGLVESLDPRRVAIALGACLAILAGLGAATLLGDAEIPAFVPNEERTVPAIFSSMLLYGAGGVAILIGLRSDAESRRWWVLWGAALILLGFDEGAEGHERLEVRTGLPAAVVLGPLAVAAAAGWLGTYRLLERRAVRTLYVAAAAAWVLSQATDPVHGVDWKSLIEEMLEMAGSALFLVALLIVLQAHRRPPGPPR